MHTNRKGEIFMLESRDIIRALEKIDCKIVILKIYMEECTEFDQDWVLEELEQIDKIVTELLLLNFMSDYDERNGKI